MPSTLPTTASAPRILAFATQGAGGDDEARLRALLSGLPNVEWFAFDRRSKAKSMLRLFRRVVSSKPDLVVMEGTGVAGGLPLLAARWLGRRYVVSSGDAVGPFVKAIQPLAGPIFSLYERRLCGRASGFIGWTPYLAGRALTFGCPRAMTAAGWAPVRLSVEERERARVETRARLGIPTDALVLGIVGSLAWNRRVGYCYGHELVSALPLIRRRDAYIVVVGDGSGKERLEAMIGRDGLDRCILTGRVAREEVPNLLASFDVASLPQSLDGVGLFRYTTKISEYLAAGLPIVTGRLPFAYDLEGPFVWRIAGDKPWDDRYHRSLAAFADALSREELERARARVDPEAPAFRKADQIARTTAFLTELIDDAGFSHSRG